MAQVVWNTLAFLLINFIGFTRKPPNIPIYWKFLYWYVCVCRQRKMYLAREREPSRSLDWASRVCSLLPVVLRAREYLLYFKFYTPAHQIP